MDLTQSNGREYALSLACRSERREYRGGPRVLYMACPNIELLPVPAIGLTFPGLPTYFLYRTSTIHALQHAL